MRQRLILLALLAVLVTIAACESDNAKDDTSNESRATTSEPTTSGKGGPASGGIVAVRLEGIGGHFREGFEIGLRFENAEGEVIAATLWGDFVQSQGILSLDAFYDSVLEQVVPMGEIVVLATVNVGQAGAAVPPDLDGDLKCRLEVQVPESGRVDVEVGFSNHENCLRVIPGGWQEPPSLPWAVSDMTGEGQDMQGLSGRGEVHLK